MELFRMSATTRRRKWRISRARSDWEEKEKSLEDDIERSNGARESPDAENAQVKARITNLEADNQELREEKTKLTSNN